MPPWEAKQIVGWTFGSCPASSRRVRLGAWDKPGFVTEGDDRGVPGTERSPKGLVFPEGAREILDPEVNVEPLIPSIVGFG